MVLGAPALGPQLGMLQEWLTGTAEPHIYRNPKPSPLSPLQNLGNTGQDFFCRMQCVNLTVPAFEGNFQQTFETIAELSGRASQLGVA